MISVLFKKSCWECCPANSSCLRHSWRTACNLIAQQPLLQSKTQAFTKSQPFCFHWGASLTAGHRLESSRFLLLFNASLLHRSTRGPRTVTIKSGSFQESLQTLPTTVLWSPWTLLSILNRSFIKTGKLLARYIPAQSREIETSKRFSQRATRFQDENCK